MYKFRENSRVCFFGDSITHGGLWIRRIYDYYLKNGIKLEMYNCGVAGDNAAYAYERINETVLCHEPTDVVLDFGMNDVQYSLYDSRDVTPEVVLMRRNAIDSCVNNIEKLASRLSSKGVNLIFCTPTPYDEISDGEKEVFLGVEYALREVGDRIKLISKEYGSHIVDFNAGMLGVMKKLHKEDKTLHRPDRVHPDPVGQELMAQIFLSAQGFDVKVDDCYENLLALSQSEYSEWETKRYYLEQEAKATDYVKYVSLRSEKSHEDTVAVINEALERDNFRNPAVKRYYLAYLEKHASAEDFVKQLKEHTKSILLS